MLFDSDHRPGVLIVERERRAERGDEPEHAEGSGGDVDAQRTVHENGKEGALKLRALDLESKSRWIFF